MSETTTTRSQLRQSLVQHIFHYFDELKKTNSEENARKIVFEELNKMKQMFGEEEASVSFLTELLEQEDYWKAENKQARTKKDVDRMYYSEEVLSSIKVLNQATRGESHGIK